MSEKSIKACLRTSMKSVSKDWLNLKNETAKQKRISQRQLEKVRYYTPPRVTVKDAAYHVMEEAYRKASSDGRYPANARQIMYAARPRIIELTGNPQALSNSAYFTQTLLPSFIEDNPSVTKQWDVVYDARGKMVEPHTDKRIDLGTVEVRRYISGWMNGDIGDSLDLDFCLPRRVKTAGPSNRYKYALFIEKEGFNELLKAALISERFDMAIMSTKGMSVTASRTLVEELSEQGVTIFVLHDFDKAGFSIVHTLRTDTRRYRFRSEPNVIDLGLRLDDVKAMGLESEAVTYPGNTNPGWNLKESGATEEECDFLVQRDRWGSWKGERVELNSMTSEQFIQFIERKFEEHGVEKFVPETEVLEQTYKRACRLTAIEKAMAEADREFQDDKVDIPDELGNSVKRMIEGKSQSWDDTVWDLAKKGVE
ncbi:MAG: DUF2399 domain-containing protein [bacterium]